MFPQHREKTLCLPRYCTAKVWERWDNCVLFGMVQNNNVHTLKTAAIVVSFCNARVFGLQGCLQRDRRLFFIAGRAAPELCAGSDRYVSPRADKLQAACTATLGTTPPWINLFSVSSAWTSTKQAQTACSFGAQSNVPRSGMRCRKEKPALFLLVLYLLSEWTNSS